MQIGLIALTLAGMFFLPSVNATVITIPGHSEGSRQIIPKRGISMEDVLKNLVNPNNALNLSVNLLLWNGLMVHFVFILNIVLFYTQSTLKRLYCLISNKQSPKPYLFKFTTH